MKKIIFFILAAVGLLIYSNTLHSSFVFDDLAAIVQNPAIRHLDLASLWHAFNTRFVVGLTLAFNYALGKENVMGYHLFNIFIHILNSFLVYELTCLSLQTPRMPKSSLHPKLIGFLTALVFLTHPIQTQAVTYIWQRATSLAAFFYLGSLVFYIRGRLQSSRKDYILCLLFTVLGMFTKEIVFTLPLMIILYEFIFLSSPKSLIGDQSGFDSRLKHSGMTVLAPLLLTLFIIPMTLAASDGQSTLKFLRPTAIPSNLFEITRGIEKEKIPRKEYLLTEINVFRTYLRLLFVPIKQNLDYDYPKSTSLVEPRTLASFLLLMGLLTAAFIFLKKEPLLAWGIFWFFLTLSVEALISQKEFIFEHRLYLPMAGFSLFLVAAPARLCGKNPRRLALILMGAIACYSILTYRRNFVWKDETSLWSDAIVHSPKKVRPYKNRGSAHQRSGRLDQALLDFNKVIELEPNNPENADAYSNRASVYGTKGLLDKALLDCNRAIELGPNFAEAYNNRAIIYKQKGDFDRALGDYHKAIELEPNFAIAYNNRGAVYGMKGFWDLALADFNKAIQLNPGFASARQNKAVAEGLKKK